MVSDPLINYWGFITISCKVYLYEVAISI